MCSGRDWGTWAVVLGLFVWPRHSAAESDARVHLGLETSIYSATSVEGTSSTTATGTSTPSTTAKSVANTSELGFPGNTALSLGALLGDSFDIGARLGYRSGKTKVGSDAYAQERETTTYTLSPYAAYLAGAQRDSVRFTIGLFAGIGAGTTKTTTPTVSSSGGPATTTAETTISSTEYGAFLGLRGFAGEVMSLDPMILLARNSTTYKPGGGNADVDLTGTTFMLNVGFTLWARGTPAPAKPAAPAATADEPDSASASTPRPIAVPGEKSYRITLNLEEGRTITIVRKPQSEDPDVAIALRDGDNDIRKSNCNQVTLHAPGQEHAIVEVESGMASNSTRRYPVLKGLIPIENVRRLLVAPIASDAAVPDHFIDVCGQRWNLIESERRRLKKYALGLPKSAPKPDTSTEEVAAPAPPEAAPAGAAPAPPEAAPTVAAPTKTKK